MRTKEEIFKDTDETLFFIKCKLSFKFFVENVVGLIPDTYQLDWVDTLETNDRLSVIASTGHGKTACMGSWYILWKLFTKSNWHALIVSNSLNQAKKILADIVEIIDNNEVLKDLKGNKEIDNTTQFNTRNRCRVFCAPNSKNVRGVHVDYVLADEASAYDDHDVFFRYIETRAVAKQGKLCAISTLSDANDLMSKLRNNPQYKTVITACYNKDGTPSSHRFSVEQLLGIKLTIGELAFRKEYLCDVSVVLDAIYPPDLVSSCFDNNIAFSLNKDDYKGLIYMGCDFAYSATGDYTVFTVVDVFNNIITIRHMERHRGMPISEQTDRIRALYQMLDPASILVDGSNFGQAIAKELINDGLPIYEQNFAPIHRQHLLQYLKHRMESGKIVIPHKDDINTTHIIDQLKLELTSFKVKKTPAGAVTFQASSAHDDCLDGETLIKSMRGWIKIKDIKTGDLVLTHKNRYKKVLTCNKRLMKDNETMYSIITTGRPAL